MYKHSKTLTDGKQLKAGRIILGMTIDEIAKEVNINRNSVIRAEAYTSLPFAAHAGERIANYLISKGIEFSILDGKPTVSFIGHNRREKKYQKVDQQSRYATNTRAREENYNNPSKT